MEKFNRTYQNSKASRSNRFCTVSCVSWIVVTIWVIFLLYCYESGLILSSNNDNAIVSGSDTFATLPQVISNKTSLRSNIIKSTSNNNNNLVVTNDEDEFIHVIFSTDCTPYQDWQSIVVFYTAQVIKQKGTITRIASGCDEKKQNELKSLYEKLYPQYAVHFTPDFKKDEKTNRKYDFYNKPWGLKHWLANANPPVNDNAIIVLIDPDMMFLRPITVKIKGQPNNLFSKSLKDNDIIDKIMEGKPVAQTYGLGAPWANDNHKKFNRGKICGEGSPCLVPTERYGNQHYSVGPPYIVHKRDMEKIAESWTTFVPRVYEGYPFLLAEMYAYSMAAAHQKLPHLQMYNYMVSNVDIGDSEGWAHIDKLSNVCAPPDSNGIYFDNNPLPNLLHYCQSYRAGSYGWTKRQSPHDIFSCNSDVYVEPPINLQDETYRIKKGVKEDLNKQMAKRNAFMICTIQRTINAAVEDYKQRMCSPAEIRSNKTLNVLNNMS